MDNPHLSERYVSQGTDAFLLHNRLSEILEPDLLIVNE
jgi:hypothetical protein